MNELTALPPEIGELTQLTELSLSINPLESPPPEIVAQGTKAILVYLQAQKKKLKNNDLLLDGIFNPVRKFSSVLYAMQLRCFAVRRLMLLISYKMR